MNIKVPIRALRAAYRKSPLTNVFVGFDQTRSCQIVFQPNCLCLLHMVSYGADGCNLGLRLQIMARTDHLAAGL